LDDNQLAELIEGLKINNLDHYSHVINGYIGSDSFLKQLATTVKHLKSKNPELVYVCDPVMGDTGPGWYVPQSLLPIYRDEILPLADVCVPNQVRCSTCIRRTHHAERLVDPNFLVSDYGYPGHSM
jgi:pyridoxine kinase